MSGSYRSNFKGAGVSVFGASCLRARGRHPSHRLESQRALPRALIKRYEEERELTVFLIVDVSGSGEFGTRRSSSPKSRPRSAECSPTRLLMRVIKSGVLLFSGKVEKIIPPKRGRQHILRIIRDILSFKPQSKGTNLRGALESAARIMKHTGVVFVISDFVLTIMTWRCGGSPEDMT